MNKFIKLSIKKGVKNNKNWYILKITHVYQSGKKYVETIFLNENEYKELAQNNNIVTE